MIRRLLHRLLESEEKKLGESVEYLHHIVDVSPGAFFRFASISPFANSRKTLPANAWFVAQLVALQAEDCGTCLQIGVNNARKEGIDSALVRDVLRGDCEALTPETADVYRFTRSILAATGDEGPLRETLRARYGDRGLIEISYAVASSRIPPIVKRTLGYAKSCSAVPVRL